MYGLMRVVLQGDLLSLLSFLHGYREREDTRFPLLFFFLALPPVCERVVSTSLPTSPVEVCGY